MLETRDPIERLRSELERPPLFSERNGYAPLDRDPLLAIVDEIEHAYIKLPVDADGVTIKVGDVLIRGQDRPTRIASVEYYADGVRVFNEDCYAINFWDYHHHHEPETLDDILDEMRRNAGCKFHSDGSCEMMFSEANIVEYAERIREAVIYEERR